MKKPEVDPQLLRVIEKRWRAIKSMPEGPEKQDALDLMYQIQGKIVEKYDLPVQPISPDAHLLGLLDWGTGLARTSVGEPVLAAKAGYDKLTKGKTNWTPGAAADRIASAIIPVGEPATSSGQYLEMAGVPDMGHLSNTYVGQKLGVDPGSRWDITGRGALGFGLDMGLTPRNLGKIPEVAARTEAALNAYRDTGRLAEIGPAWQDAIPPPRKSYEQPLPLDGGAPQTAARLRAVEEMRADAAKRAGAPGVSGVLRGVPPAVTNFMTDPQTQLANLLHDWRFRYANEAARLKGKQLPGEIMREHGGKGITSEGIRADMQQALSQHEDEIKKLGESAPFTRKVPRGSPDDYEYLNTPEYAKEVTVDDTALYPLYSAEQKAAERAIVGGADAQAARRYIEDRVRQAERVNPGFDSAEKTWEDAGQAAGTRATADSGQGVLDLYTQPPEEVTRVGPQVSLGGVERPFKTVTTIEGTPATHGLPPSELDPLSLPRDMGWEEIRKARQQAQSEAAQRDWYNRRSDQLQPAKPGEAKAVEAEASLYAKWAKHLGELETDILDEARPGLGGQVYRRHQDMAGLLEGGKWLDRSPTRGATSRSQIAFNPWTGRALVAGEGLLNAGAMAGYQALRSPFTKYLAAPAARSMWLNNYWQRQAEGNSDNPYALIYDYERKR